MEASNPGTCCGIFNKLVTMGFKPAPCGPENRLPQEVEGYYLTALFTGAQSDIGFHLFKCDGKNNPGKRRGWSELLPGLLPRNRDDFGKPILDPRTARYFEGSMTPHFISFFHVPNEGMDRDAVHRMVPKSALNLQNPPLQPSVL